MSDRTVPVWPLRRAFERSGVSASEVARRLGWTVVSPDSQRVRGRLGLKAVAGRRNEQITYDVAVRLAEAIGVDPVDVGL